MFSLPTKKKEEAKVVENETVRPSGKSQRGPNLSSSFI